jgi:uncharacterized protein (UPF0332 family)
MKDSIEEYVKYRLKRANESLEEAQMMATTKRWNTCVNRLYYACYYCTSALLLTQGIDSKTHNGVHSQFNLHFIKTAMVAKEHGNLFTDLMNMRAKGDYGDMFDYDEKKVKPLIPKVKKFIHDIEKLIKKNNL